MATSRPEVRTGEDQWQPPVMGRPRLGLPPPTGELAPRQLSRLSHVSAMAFSPDSREICFSRYVENEALTGNSDLFVISATGGTPKPITTNKSTDKTPLYSPDGRYIAYSATLRPMPLSIASFARRSAS